MPNVDLSNTDYLEETPVIPPDIYTVRIDGVE